MEFELRISAKSVACTHSHSCQHEKYNKLQMNEVTVVASKIELASRNFHENKRTEKYVHDLDTLGLVRILACLRRRGCHCTVEYEYDVRRRSFRCISVVSKNVPLCENIKAHSVPRKCWNFFLKHKFHSIAFEKRIYINFLFGSILKACFYVIANLMVMRDFISCVILLLSHKVMFNFKTRNAI